jgi:hypothetical protein
MNPKGDGQNASESRAACISDKSNEKEIDFGVGISQSTKRHLISSIAEEELMEKAMRCEVHYIQNINISEQMTHQLYSSK